MLIDRTPWSTSHPWGVPDPFNDVASQSTPETMPALLRWCEHIVASANGVYRSAIDRVLSYFITDIDVKNVGDDEKKRYTDFFTDSLGISNVLHSAGMDFMAYGNCFLSAIMKFRRYLSCRKCHFELPLKQAHESREFQFRWQNFEFHAHCPKCHTSGKWDHVDRRADDERVRVKRWNPHEMELKWDPFTDDVSYIWKIPDYYRRMIAEGNIYHLERANWEIIEAIRDQKWLEFEPDVIFHLKEETLAGIYNRGWGISRVLSNFKQLWYVQVLHRYNEAIALDYVIPFRVITPAPGAGGGGDPAMKDPIMNMNLGGFVSRVQGMIRTRRRDPASWHVLPFPVQYQVLGGDAKALAPKELIDQGLEVLLNNAGVPVELYRGSLQLQTAPTALRLFESNHAYLVHNLNRVLDFLARRVATLMSWEPAKVQLQRTTQVDDLQKQLSKLQLMMSGQVSPSSGLKSIGMEFREEIQRMMDDERYKAEQSKKLQEDMERAGLAAQMQQGSMPVPGQPQPAGPAPAAGGGAPAPLASPADSLAMSSSQASTPQELMEQATVLAQELLALPDSQRRSELIRIKRVNPTLHGIVTAVMRDIRQQARTLGGGMILEQQFGGGAGQPPAQ